VDEAEAEAALAEAAAAAAEREKAEPTLIPRPLQAYARFIR